MSARIKLEPLEDDDVSINSASPDDEIVREIDVYLSPALAPRLYLMQFPQQHRSVSLPQAARIKPRHGLLELDQAVPRSQCARQDMSDAINFPHRTHVSHSIPVSTHMALGKLEGAALHLVPLTHITQMRPDFNHIDEAMYPTLDPLGGDNNMDEESAKLEKKPLMFQKKESERAALARQNSYAYKKATEEAEEWQYLDVQGPGTLAYAQVQQTVACPSPQTSLAHVQQQQPNEDASSAFVHSLNYLATTSGQETGTVSERAMDGGDLKEICKKLIGLLYRGWPVPYSVLRARFSPSVDNLNILTALSSCAVLVRGNFVLQSRYMSLSAPIQHARTFILYLIQTFGSVQRFRLDHAYWGDTVVTPEVVHMLLQQVAEKRLNGWISKLGDNVGFYQSFPEQTQIHLQYWERQASRFASLVEKYDEASFEEI